MTSEFTTMYNASAVRSTLERFLRMENIFVPKTRYSISCVEKFTTLAL
jgi:hypothetical protein